jgi:3-dehydroquinate synthetase
MGLCASTVPDRLESLLSRTGLPVRHSADPDELIEVMAADKKAVEGRVRFVLIKSIGQVEYGIEVKRTFSDRFWRILRTADGSSARC